MVLRFKNKDGTGGVLCRPYTWAERMWLKDFATRDHGGPVITVGPRAGASTNRQTLPAAVDPATGPASAPDQPPETKQPRRR